MMQFRSSEQKEEKLRWIVMDPTKVRKKENNTKMA